MEWIALPFIGVALIILAGAIAQAISAFAKAKSQQLAGGGSALDADELRRRLDEVDGRLRDVLDVMLAINDKMERWERGDGVAFAPRRGRDAAGE